MPVKSYNGIARPYISSLNSKNISSIKKINNINIRPSFLDTAFSSVSLLLHCNGGNGSTRFIDSSSSNKNLTANGSVQISTAQSKFGNSSGFFDGSAGSDVTIPDSSDFDLGISSEPFTIESWIRLSATGTTMSLFGKGGGFGGWNGTNGHQYVLYYNNDGSMYFQWWNGAGVEQLAAASGMSANVWYHLALAYDGSIIRMFINGSIIGSTSSPTFAEPSSSSTIKLGGNAVSSETKWNGYVDDFRITKGVCRYTRNFNPPTREFPDSGYPSSPTSVATQGWWRADSLLELSDGEAVSSWMDSSGNNYHAKQTSSSLKPVYKLGIINNLPALLFDGSNDALKASMTRNANDSVFIVMKPTDTSLTQNRSFIEANATNTKRLFETGNTYQYITAYNGSAFANTAVAQGNWVVVCISWNGASSKLTVNGTTVTGNPGSSTANDLWIGASSGHSVTMQGYIAEVILYNSVLSDTDRDEILSYLNRKYGTIY